jgi:xanthine dehydrogenase accessory factor
MMYDVFREAASVLERGEPCVLATVTRTKGSTPQKAGAKLLVRQDGSGVGTLGGGCVEGDIWFAAKMLLRDGGGPEIKDYFLSEELAARDGLVCGGTMYFLLDPIREANNALPYLNDILNAYQGGQAVALATVTNPGSGTPTSVGSRIVIREDGFMDGSLGDTSVDAMVVEQCQELMRYGNCDYVTAGNGMELFIEAYTTPPTLVLMGGGHISLALSKLAAPLGFRVFVVEDRPEFANPERFPMAERTIVVPSYDRGLEQVPVGSNTFIVIATRGHKYDDMATESAARSRAGYVGLLGSQRKSLLIYQELFRKGVTEERIREIHSPVGLNIGGRTPEEIAMSIMAEILMCRLGGDGRPMKMEERLLLTAKQKGLKVVPRR